MSANPLDRLEIQALQQRNEVTIDALNGKIIEVCAKLDPNANTRAHLLAASLVVSSIGFLAGYGLAGLFSSSK